MDIARLRRKIREARERDDEARPAVHPVQPAQPAESLPEEAAAPEPEIEASASETGERQATVATESGEPLPGNERPRHEEPPIQTDDVQGEVAGPFVSPPVTAGPEPGEHGEDPDPGFPESPDEADVADDTVTSGWTDEGDGSGAVDEMVELLGFRAGGEEFCVRITDVGEILRMQRITRIPRAPDYLLGVTSLRGKMIPVLDLKQKLSLAFITPSSSRILVLGGSASPFGLCVDSLIGVMRVRPEEIRPPLGTLGESEAQLIEGVAMVDGGFVSLLDLESIGQIDLEWKI